VESSLDGILVDPHCDDDQPQFYIDWDAEIPQRDNQQDPCPDLVEENIEEKEDMEKYNSQEEFNLEKVLSVLNNCSMIIGMHPDQAAGAIIDFALSRNVPFAITPCCVYSDQFPKRRLKNGEKVRTDEQFITYLREKSPSILMQTLPFEGKNIVLYSDPSLWKKSN